MKGTKRHIGMRAVAAIAVAIGALALLATQAFAQEVSIGDVSADLGAEVTVELNAADIGDDPGLGAWSIDVTYDPDVVSVVDCDASVRGGTAVCNDAFDNDTVRVAGAAGVGIDRDSTLLEITFECGDTEGTSPLEIDLVHFADGTIGGPLPIDADVIDGSITCEAGAAAGLPPAGTGGRSDQGMLYALTGLLAAVGLAVVGRGLLARRA